MEDVERKEPSVAAIACWQLIPVFLWGAVSLYWMPIGIHWKWLSCGFLLSFASLFFFVSRMAKEKQHEIILPPLPPPQVIPSFEKEFEALQKELTDKNELLSFLEKEKKKMEEEALSSLKEYQASLEEKEGEILRLAASLNAQENLLLEKEITCQEWQKKNLDLQEKVADLKLELDTLLATGDSKEERELFFFFSEEEATQFLAKKQKEALPFLHHSPSALESWIEHQKEGFLLLFSGDEDRIVASNLPLFPLFTRNTEKWLIEDKDPQSVHKIVYGETVFLFKKIDPSPLTASIFLATAYHTLAEISG